jgi:acetoin utilization deacetylase AcuC-like enzyme
MHYKTHWKVFYHPLMSIPSKIGFSRSPEKPQKFIDFLMKTDLKEYLDLDSQFEPFLNQDFELAHQNSYIQNFFQGIEPDASSNGLKWTREFANSVRYTNSSLYHSVRHSILNPQVISLSPTSGFHHATPSGGQGFCSFSGQVITSIKIWSEFGKRGAYIDLDEHFGNSIEDSRSHCKSLGYNLDSIIPKYANLNPVGKHKSYIKDLQEKWQKIEEEIVKGEIDYLVFCSGADSLVDDDLGGSVSFSEWLFCKEFLYQRVKTLLEQLERPIPLTVTLFGGYRADDFNSVLDAHTMDLAICSKVLQGNNWNYKSVYKIKNSF